MIDKDFINKIKEDLEKDCPDVPEGISPSNIAKLVDGTKQKKKKPNIIRFVALAASLAIVVTGSLSAMKSYRPKQKPIASENGQKVYTGSYEEIESFFLSMRKDIELQNTLNSFNAFSFGEKYTQEVEIFDGGFNNGNDMSYSSSASSQTTGSSPNESSYSKTDLQVNGVDEGDIVKNDGKYLYVVMNKYDSQVIKIIDTQNPKELKVVSTIAFPTSRQGEWVSIHDIYLNDNFLTVIYSKNYYNELYENGACCFVGNDDKPTYVSVYDISNRAEPKEISTCGIDGRYNSSRVSNGEITVITNFVVSLYEDNEKLKDNCIPSTYIDNNKSHISANKIGIVNGNTENCYTVIMKAKLSNLKSTIDSYAILGNSNEMYSNGKRLYLSRNCYNEEAQNISTEIYAFNIENSVEFIGTCSVDGELLNQYSMDEYNGYLRVASCERNTQSYVTIFDENLNQVSKLDSIGKDESIFAIRFMGDTAYVVTFRNTDPLFVIDLSEPSAPKIVGELQIPGFSNMLFPYSDNLLIGVGQENNVAKVSLFDISDKTSPKEISKAYISENSNSVAQYDHRAFLKFTDTNEFAIPIETWGNHSIFICSFKIENNTLIQSKKYTVKTDVDYYDINRAAYTDNTVFAISYGFVVAFDRTTTEALSYIALEDDNASIETTEPYVYVVN